MFTYLHGALADCIFQSIVEDTILKYKSHVTHELINVFIGISAYPLLYGSEVHRILDDLEVVEYSISLGIDWLMEYLSSLVLPT